VTHLSAADLVKTVSLDHDQPGRIHVQQDAIPVQQLDALGFVVDDGPQIGLFFLEGRFRADPLGQVDKRGQEILAEGDPRNLEDSDFSILAGDPIGHGRNVAAALPGLRHRLYPGVQHPLPVVRIGIGQKPPLRQGGRLGFGITDPFEEALVAEDQSAAAVHITQGQRGKLQDPLQAGPACLQFLLGLLALGDIDAMANEAGELTPAIVARGAFRLHPAIFPVVTAQTVVQTEGLAPFEGGCMGLLKALPIFGMDRFAVAFAQGLVQPLAREIQPGLVEVATPLVPVRGPDQGLARVGQGTEMGFAFRQPPFHGPPLDGQAGQLHRPTQGLKFLAGRRPGGGAIDGEGAQHLAAGIEDGLRPAGAKTGAGDDCLVGLPIGMGLQVFAHHPPPFTHRRAAGADAESNLQALEGFVIETGQMRGRA